MGSGEKASSSALQAHTRKCLKRRARCHALLISGSKVRVLDDPPIESATSRAVGVADTVFATILLTLRSSSRLIGRLVSHQRVKDDPGTLRRGATCTIMATMPPSAPRAARGPDLTASRTLSHCRLSALSLTLGIASTETPQVHAIHTTQSPYEVCGASTPR